MVDIIPGADVAKAVLYVDTAAFDAGCKRLSLIPVVCLLFNDDELFVSPVVECRKSRFVA